MWEYKRKNYEFKMFPEIEEYLNEEGKDGWDVICYQEEKPEKFGENYKVKVLYKRKKE